MQPWRTVARITTAEGPLELRQRGANEFLIVAAGRVLMTSAARRSEEALATHGCAAVRGHAAPRILVGGLGMAFTLRAALDALPARARVTVVELNAAIVDWCRGPLAGPTAGAIDDPRVAVQIADVAHVIAAAAPRSFGAILLDLYEGPYAATQERDDPIYGPAALAAAHAALAPGGALAVWAEDLDPTFAPRLDRAGFGVTIHREGHGGRKHVVYVGARRPIGA